MTKDLLKKSGYSEKAIEYFLNKLHVGSLQNPSVEYSYKGHCGDTMKIFLKINSDIITEASFEAIGCAGAYSAGSALIELIKGKHINVAEKITEADIIEHLGDIPPSKADCIVLVKKTFEKTLDHYLNNNQ
ncbi:iron-sulfur cluster assembly scaffold protein [candidate division KSB1 bacterium]